MSDLQAMYRAAAQVLYNISYSEVELVMAGSNASARLMDIAKEAVDAALAALGHGDSLYVRKGSDGVTRTSQYVKVWPIKAPILTTFWRPEDGPDTCWVCGELTEYAYLDQAYQHPDCDAYPRDGKDVRIIKGREVVDTSVYDHT